MQRIPARELEVAARTLLAAGDVASKVEVLHCLADMQQVMFAAVIADHLEVSERPVRDAAREALQLLTCEDVPIQSKAQFAAWFATHGSMRYVDLVQNAARRGLRPADHMRSELARLRVDAARDVVQALVLRSPGVDWAAVRERMLVEDPAVLDACLVLLLQAISNGLPLEENANARQALSRGLLQRFVDTSAEDTERRSRLLEIAAYLTRAEETELATEVTVLLNAQIDGDDVAARIRAIRGLRRFPTVENRQKLLQVARGLLPVGEASREQMMAILTTLSSRFVPRWSAPLPSDPDRAEWLSLVSDLFRTGAELGWREPALLLAQTPDAKEQRIPEAFGVLVSLVTNGTLDIEFRTLCLFHLQAWGGDQEHADAWVQVLHRLLADAAPQLRLRAAESLAQLPEAVDTRRGDWIGATLMVLRDRLVIEPDQPVLRALVQCVQVCGSEPQMPEKAIGALKYALAQLGQPILAEHQFRLDPLLLALSAIAANPRADRGQWLPACGPLLANKRRQSLRNVLQSHVAIDLAKDVVSADAGLADRARQAMLVLIETALLKSARNGWSETEDLQREARDVRAAFGALDRLEEAQRPDKSWYRLLRLEVDSALGKYLEVVQRGVPWLAAVGESGVSYSADELPRAQLLVAEAQLQLGKPEAALQLVDEAKLEPSPAVLDLQCRIAKALAPIDPRRAAELQERAWRATAAEDPAFRQRLVDWMQYRLRQDAGAREEVMRESSKYVPSFAAADCSPELREAFEQLRTAR